MFKIYMNFYLYEHLPEYILCGPFVCLVPTESPEKGPGAAGTGVEGRRE